MRTSDFDFELPEDAIAQYPAPRGWSRLLDVRHGSKQVHRFIHELPGLLRPGDVLVVNDTRVRPVRLHTRRGTGGRVEILLLRELPSEPPGVEWEALLRPGRRCRLGTELVLAPGLTATVGGRAGDVFRLRFSEPVAARLDELGEVPLPPYIRRPVQAADLERYQTVFASRPGAVAAPTAGLHFDESLLRRLDERGVRRFALTLHVGPGTFRPVTADDPGHHRMDAERYDLPEATAAAIAQGKREGRRIVAVGTTVVRTLEGVAARSAGVLEPGAGEVDLFITPGFSFRIVDLLLTNFHLPRSTLLMLVCAFAGRERVLSAYADALADGYRFYSYGDAMLLDRAPG